MDSEQTSKFAVVCEEAPRPLVEKHALQSASLPAVGDSSVKSWAVIDEFLDELMVENVFASCERITAKPTFAPRTLDHDMFFIVLEGSVNCLIGPCSYAVSSGGLVHVRKGELFGCSSRIGPASIVIKCHYDAHLSDTIDLNDLLELPNVVNLCPSSNVRNYLIQAAQLSTSAPVGTLQCLKSLIVLVLLSLLRDYLPESCLLLDRKQIAQMRRLLPAIRDLRRDLSTLSSIDGLAKQCGLSVAQFRRLFQMVFGQSPSQYIQKMRMQEACRLLHKTDRTVNEICLRVGYEQPSYFHKTFKRITGFTPKCYREEVEPQLQAS